MYLLRKWSDGNLFHCRSRWILAWDSAVKLAGKSKKSCWSDFQRTLRGCVIMRTIGNILWFIFGGLLGGLAWVFAGCIWCITIIGIPVGLQCFKFATLAFWPFGKEIVYGNGMFSFLVNLIWIVFFGWEMALGNLIVGCIWCITIVGIPFGKQFFKMARLSFMPFGASVIG